MRQGIAWLHGELPRLVAQGILTPEAADALRCHYGPPEHETPRTAWGQILLASFGALLVGGGIILILAHNWEGLGRPARAAIALGVLIAAQVLTIFGVARRRTSMAWIEATSALLVTAVGAAMALVGQTYHLGGSFEGLMRAWLWLVILIPYLTGSSLGAIAFWGLLVVRVVDLGWHDAPWDPWLLVLGGVPFVVLRVRRQPHSWATALVTMSAAGSIMVVGWLATIQAGWNGLWAVFQVSFLSAVIAAASWPPSNESATIEAWRGRLLAPAWIAINLIGTALSFDDAWHTVSITSRHLHNPNVVGAAVLAVACAIFASIQSIYLARAGRSAIAACTSAAFLAVVAHGLAILGLDVGWIVFNVWLLAVGSLTLIEGVRRLALGTANRGLLTLSALALARFFDSDLTFLARGIAFVVLGIACFALNVWLMRRVRRGTP